ncbi:hypothetical protein UFOVP209_37 [uncultured Caudovirales phage]|uniref:Uncharacterized protein n=1 Tax=uncultured Caudovirales phage TaxID=2100421 RepID=A0A6J7WMQ4_9CAUD|nr:hypothetical protein UFOVP209_37 [uncultured Caudovirales phage]
MNTHPQGGQWQSVAAEAADLVFGERGRIYSHPHDDYSTVVNINLAICPDDFIGGDTVIGAIYQMVSVKLARLKFGLEQGFPPEMLRDHFVDTCGYMDCLWAAVEREFEFTTDDAIEELTNDE